jgi:hypothetical protein
VRQAPNPTVGSKGAEVQRVTPPAPVPLTFPSAGEVNEALRALGGIISKQRPGKRLSRRRGCAARVGSPAVVAARPPGMSNPRITGGPAVYQLGGTPNRATGTPPLPARRPAPLRRLVWVREPQPGPDGCESWQEGLLADVTQRRNAGSPGAASPEYSKASDQVGTMSAIFHSRLQAVHLYQ